MKKAVATRWVKALRSGKYKQTKGRLRNITNAASMTSAPEGYCCLGVLCDLASRSKTFYGKWDGDRFDPKEQGSSYGEAPSGYPPTSVWRDFAGMIEKDPDVVIDGLYYSLASLNDSGKSFNDIADLIEANYKIF